MADDNVFNPFRVNEPQENTPRGNASNPFASGPEDTFVDLDEYNPFRMPDSGPYSAPPPSSTLKPSSNYVATLPMNEPPRFANPPTLPPTLPSVRQPPPPSSSAAAKPVDISELQRRQRELEAREAQLRVQEEQLAAAGPKGRVADNFPPLPKFCPCGPCFYHNIAEEIPLQHRNLVRFSFGVWLGHIFSLFLNIVAGVAYMVEDNSGNGGATFGMAIVWFLVLTPLSFLLWYRSLYKVFKNNSSFYFLIFFIFLAIQIIILAIQALGMDWMAGCGWINGTKIFHKRHSAGIIMFLSAALFTGLGVIDCVLIGLVYRHYRLAGLSVEKAKQEAILNSTEGSRLF